MKELVNEQLLSFVWTYKLFQSELTLCGSNQRVEILHPGIKNLDSGPDFTNARLNIGGLIWAGDVEIHVKASDWHKHKHTHNSAYNTVILHVVYEADAVISDAQGRELPMIEVEVNTEMMDAYKKFMLSDNVVVCGNRIKEVESFTISSWLNRLHVERLENKFTYIKNLYEFLGSDLNETFYVLLAKGFGFHTNSLPFEQLAKSLPYHILLKNLDNPLALEALVFGQAGWLNDCDVDDYVMKLQQEYAYYQHKYSLTPLNKSIWKTNRIRPGNHPHFRLAQWLSLVSKAHGLAAGTHAVSDLKTARDFFDIAMPLYWQNHDALARSCKPRKTGLSADAINLLIVNVLVPFLYFRGKLISEAESEELPERILSDLAAEKNSIVQGFEKFGIKAVNAAESQALLQLYNEYCTHKKCLQCRIGHKLLISHKKF